MLGYKGMQDFVTPFIELSYSLSLVLCTPNSVPEWIAKTHYSALPSPKSRQINHGKT
jgi:hypothetical protein